MRNIAVLALVVMACGCGGSTDDIFKSVAVIEVPLRAPSDQRDLIAIMRGLAAANALHVDDVSNKWRAFQQSRTADRPSDAVDTRATIYVGVWRGPGDEDIEVEISDMTHLGRAWVTFIQGGQDDLRPETRQRVLAKIKRRWPDARSVPILPSGGLPLAKDLRWTPQGYRIAAPAAQTYGLSDTSPLVIQD